MFECNNINMCSIKHHTSLLFTVALNYQTAGLMMDLYHGWFQKNGGCGYILKPAIMREEIAYFSANTKDVIPGVSPQILHIKVCLLTSSIPHKC